MTVGELRELLAEYSDRMEVRVVSDDDRLCYINQVGIAVENATAPRLWRWLDDKADAEGNRVVAIY